MGDSSDLKTRVLEDAERKYQQNYLGASDDNCAHFVRDCFRDAGYVLPEASCPSDMAICRANGYSLGALYANSLAGDEIGRRLSVEDAEPGDIVLFTNLGASSTSFARGTITHVGICVGSNMMIDHGSSGMNKRDYRSWPGPSNYAEARRPKLFDVSKTRMSYSKGQLTGVVKNASTGSLDLKVALKGRLVASINDYAVVPKAVFLRVHDKRSGHMYRLSMQNGVTKASVDYAGVTELDCHAKMGRGALHVWINGSEVPSDETAIEIVHKS